MTPIGSRLQLTLDDEVIRMANEWFFKWHHIGGERPVEIDSFRGKPIVYGGIRFSGSAHGPTDAFYVDTQLPYPPAQDRAAPVIAHTRARHTRERASVEDMIVRQLEE